ncbi:MAG: HEAT repeat domain-containing protein [Mangrovibacterium sp.]|nr:HEAT repeat domain-containing protein [Mangrovibacterium sp.]
MKLNQETIQLLHSGNAGIVTGAIEELRENGHAGYLPVLLELLHSTNNDSIRKHITGLLAELKSQEAVPFLVEAIQNRQYAGELSAILSACWENGLDYSGYLPVFVDLVIEKEFLVAFEAYTVVINMTGGISDAVQEAVRKKIKDALGSIHENKKELLRDILDYLPE